MSKKVGKRLRAINYHNRIRAEMRKKWQEEYGVTWKHTSYSLYDITTHNQRIRFDEVIEEITGKYCDDGVDDLTDEQLIEILDQVLKSMAKKRGKELEKEIQGMIA